MTKHNDSHPAIDSMYTNIVEGNMQAQSSVPGCRQHVHIACGCKRLPSVTLTMTKTLAQHFHGVSRGQQICERPMSTLLCGLLNQCAVCAARICVPTVSIGPVKLPQVKHLPTCPALQQLLLVKL
jgi:hypothetical protein